MWSGKYAMPVVPDLDVLQACAHCSIFMQVEHTVLSSSVSPDFKLINRLNIKNETRQPIFPVVYLYSINNNYSYINISQRESHKIYKLSIRGVLHHVGWNLAL